MLDWLLLLIEERLGYALFREIERAKIDLSLEEFTSLKFNHSGIEFEEAVARTQFADISDGISQSIIHCLDETLLMAQLKPEQINRVYVTGGTSNIPALQTALAERFGRTVQGSDQFQSVVSGLAIRAQQLSR